MPEDQSKLKTPNQYLDAMNDLRRRNKDATQWVMELVKKTNCHRETDGGLWGWYEVWPLGIEVGFWGTGRDDLAGVDRDEWNRVAASLTKPAR